MDSSDWATLDNILHELGRLPYKDGAHTASWCITVAALVEKATEYCGHPLTGLFIHVPLAPFPLGKVQRRSSEDDRIKPGQLYLALDKNAHGEPWWDIGSFTKMWYGWSFDGFYAAGTQLDFIVDLWEFHPEVLLTATKEKKLKTLE